MISQTAEYALRATVFLAEHEGDASTAKIIAQETKVPEGYLAKILQGLAKAGIVKSRRGLHGGFTLAKPSEQLTVFDVIDATDPPRRYKTCPLDLPWHCKEMCKLHKTLDSMAEQFLTQARETTLADILPPANPKEVKRRKSA